MKKFLCALCGIALALTYVGCSSDDGEENGGDGGSTDYIVTKDLKQRTFANDVTAYNGAFSDSEASYLYRQQQEGNIIYEDFNVRYRLAAEAGEFRLKYYQRISGVFGFRSISEKAGIVQMPNIPSIKDISESDKKDILTSSLTHTWIYLSMAYAAFQPGYGYVIMLTTGTGEEISIRMRATHYTLDNEGSLETITLEYQLF